ncbi:hypothetical protein D3C72_1416030 [compost metagenome]
MQREHVEADEVARLDVPADDGKALARALDVGQVVEAAFGEPLGVVVHEGARHEPRPLVGAGHELERGGTRHRIDRNPHADVLHALDVVVGLVLVPRRALARAGLLHEQVVVVQAHGVGAHEPLREWRQRRLPDEAAEGVDLLPVAEVLEEAARVVGPARDLGARAGRRQVRLDAALQQREFVGREQLADADRAVALELRHQRVVHAFAHAALQVGSIEGHRRVSFFVGVSVTRFFTSPAAPAGVT